MYRHVSRLFSQYLTHTLLDVGRTNVHNDIHIATVQRYVAVTPLNSFKLWLTPSTEALMKLGGLFTSITRKNIF